MRPGLPMLGALPTALLADQTAIIYVAALAILAAALAASVVTDLRSRLIYNWVTLPALLVELILVALAAGWPGLRDSLLALLICAGPLALGSAFGAIGMGDVKLMAVVGVVAGSPSAALNVLLSVSIAGGAQAIGQWVYARARGREKPKYVPYGVAIAAGTFATWMLSR